MGTVAIIVPYKRAGLFSTFTGIRQNLQRSLVSNKILWFLRRSVNTWIRRTVGIDLWTPSTRCRLH